MFPLIGLQNPTAKCFIFLFYMMNKFGISQQLFGYRAVDGISGLCRRGWNTRAAARQNSVIRS